MDHSADQPDEGPGEFDEEDFDYDFDDQFEEETEEEARESEALHEGDFSSPPTDPASPAADRREDDAG